MLRIEKVINFQELESFINQFKSMDSLTLLKSLFDGRKHLVIYEQDELVAYFIISSKSYWKLTKKPYLNNLIKEYSLAQIYVDHN